MSDTMIAQERADRIETRAKRARAVLDVLLTGIQSDGGITDELIEETIAAAIELLEV